MKTIRNDIIPVKGFAAMNFLGILLFVRSGVELKEYIVRHEEIHSRQYKEMLWVGFLVWYVIEWLCRVTVNLVKRKDNAFKSAYSDLLMEREAKKHEREEDYLDNRKHYAWLKRQ